MARLFPAVTDHSWGRPGAHAIRDAGYLGVMRYVGDPKNGKFISEEEMKEYHDAGLFVGFVNEGDARDVLDSPDKARERARITNSWMDKFGVPDNIHIMGVVVDFDATVQQTRGPIADYARAYKEASKRPVLPYGSYVVLETLCGELGIFPCGWQTCGWSGFGKGSGGSYPCSDGTNRRLSIYACMFQDVNYVLNDTSDHNGILMPDFVRKVLWNPDVKETPTQEEVKEMATKNVIVHVDSRTSDRIRFLLDGDSHSEGFPDVAFLCNTEDFEMRQVLGDEIPKYKFYGVPEHDGQINGPEGDANWWSLFALKSRDYVGESLRR